jgi:hypothetical protein
VELRKLQAQRPELGRLVPLAAASAGAGLVRVGSGGGGRSKGGGGGAGGGGGRVHMNGDAGGYHAVTRPATP